MPISGEKTAPTVEWESLLHPASNIWFSLFYSDSTDIGPHAFTITHQCQHVMDATYSTNGMLKEQRWIHWRWNMIPPDTKSVPEGAGHLIHQTPLFVCCWIVTSLSLSLSLRIRCRHIKADFVITSIWFARGMKTWTYKLLILRILSIGWGYYIYMLLLDLCAMCSIWDFILNIPQALVLWHANQSTLKPFIRPFNKEIESTISRKIKHLNKSSFIICQHNRRCPMPARFICRYWAK